MPSQPIYGPGPGAISSDHIVKPRGVFTGPTYQSGPQPPSAPPAVTAIQQQIYPPDYGSGSAVSSHAWPVIAAQLHSFAGQVARVEEFPSYPGAVIKPPGPYPTPVLTSPPTRSLMVTSEPPAFPGASMVGRIYSPVLPIAHPIPGTFARLEEWPAHTGSTASSHEWPLNSFIHPPAMVMARVEELPPYPGMVIIGSREYPLASIVTYAYSPLSSGVVNSTRIVGGFST